MKNPNLCQFAFCGDRWVFLISKTYTEGQGKSWEFRACGKHAAPYQKGMDPYERRSCTLTARTK